MTAAAERPTTIFRRPAAETGFWSWVTTVDHKRIGVLYGYSAFLFFIIGGLEALLLRVHLASAESNFLTAAEYNGLFTTHGVTMVFLVVMPMGAAFFNYLLPLMIGARDVAFPRLNALSYWIFLFGGIFLYSGILFSGVAAPLGIEGVPGNLDPSDQTTLGSLPDGGWFLYQPNAGPNFSPGSAIDFALLGIQILGVASLISAVNFIVTIFNLRAKGMRLLRMPVFIWMTLIVAFLLLFSLPIIAIALFMATFDRQFGTLFFEAASGGDPILWQHLFWLFGHPEVYILILPAMGIVSEILPVFSRKPLFGYAAVVFAGAAIGFLGFGVWAHHMFSSGITPIAQVGFGLATMTIAVPTGVKIFNWLGTMWLGRLKLNTPMLFAIGFIAMFTIGGLSGVTHSIVPSDWQQTDTYYIVGHFHYVLFGGAILGIFGGLYYWFPKFAGRMLSDRLGKIHFWLWFIGFNMTFAPMHWLGLQGMIRRTWRYHPSLEFWNQIVSIGAFVIAIGLVVFIVNWIRSRRNGEIAGMDPWDARTLEWSIPNPTPVHNFSVVPVVHGLDEFWHQKYEEDSEGRPVRREETDGLLIRLEEEGNHPPDPIHLPNPSYFPVVAALGFPIIGYGVVFFSTLVGKGLIGLGALITLTALIGWGAEPLEEAHHQSVEAH
ncbi:MAG TPA: cytochrome c oxidase subunit I [Acidimicrobiia bacterium]|nr:cytochrome c oxidase subunit I [Acidimicrobiia bacterium]